MALVLLAPAAALARWLRRRRRGDRVVVAWRARPTAPDAHGLVRLEINLDVPEDLESRVRRDLTELVVRIAEVFAPRRAVVHLLYRVPSEPEPVVVPVGPMVQSLGERFELALSQHDLEGRTVLWMALPHGLHVARVTDPTAYDPEVGGEPEGLISVAAPLWALAVARARRGASFVVRAILFVPEAEIQRVSARLEALESRLVAAARGRH